MKTKKEQPAKYYALIGVNNSDPKQVQTKFSSKEKAITKIKTSAKALINCCDCLTVHLLDIATNRLVWSKTFLNKECEQ